jgi:hypothetical protein
VFNQDLARAVETFRRMAAIDVETACVGHGEPILAGAGHRLREVVRTRGADWVLRH